MLKKINKLNFLALCISLLNLVLYHFPFYKFVCENPEIKSCYVGHTTNFNRRKTEHKSCCNNNKCTNYKLKVYQIIRENGGWDNWKMVEVNRRICLDKIDAYKKEQQYIEELQTDMNMIKAYSNNVEYLQKYRLENADEARTNIEICISYLEKQ